MDNDYQSRNTARQITSPNESRKFKPSSASQHSDLIKVTDNWLGKQKTEGNPSATKVKATNRFTVQVLKDWKNDLENADDDDNDAETPRMRKRSA